MSNLLDKIIQVKAASRKLVKLDTEKKNLALALIAEEIESRRNELKKANSEDLKKIRKKDSPKHFSTAWNLPTKGSMA